MTQINIEGQAECFTKAQLDTSDKWDNRFFRLFMHPYEALDHLKHQLITFPPSLKPYVQELITSLEQTMAHYHLPTSYYPHHCPWR